TPPPIYFAENSDELSPEAQVALRLVSTVLAQNSKQCLMISAYASDSESKNETHKNQLCYNRAKAVIDFLITQYHVMPARLCLKIKGNDNIVKISKNKKEADRFNCRVEITTAACGYESDKKPLK
ncbi:MAG: OmpA family, partial [Bacteroidota bacterium]